MRDVPLTEGLGHTAGPDHWPTKANAVAPRISDLAHSLTILNITGTTIQRCPHTEKVRQGGIEIRGAPVDHRACGCIGDFLVCRHDLEHDATKLEVFEGVRLRDLPSYGTWQGALVPSESRWNIRYVDQNCQDGLRRDDLRWVALHVA